MWYGAVLHKFLLIYCLIALVAINPAVFAISYTASISQLSLTLEWGRSTTVYTSVTNNNFWYWLRKKKSVSKKISSKKQKIRMPTAEEIRKKIEDYKKGKQSALGAIVGFVMKETKGQANPKIVNEILMKEIG